MYKCICSKTYSPYGIVLERSPMAVLGYVQERSPMAVLLFACLFWDLSSMISMVVTPVYTPFHQHPHQYSLSFAFDDSHFPNGWRYWTLLKNLWSFCISSFKGYLFHSLVHLMIGSLGFWCVKFLVVYIFKILTPSLKYGWQRLSPNL